MCVNFVTRTKQVLELGSWDWSLPHYQLLSCNALYANIWYEGSWHDPLIKGLRGDFVFLARMNGRTNEGVPKGSHEPKHGFLQCNAVTHVYISFSADIFSINFAVCLIVAWIICIKWVALSWVSAVIWPFGVEWVKITKSAVSTSTSGYKS